MRILFLFILMFISFDAQAAVDIIVNKATQTMIVAIDSEEIATWKVSTARKGYYTPTGTFYPYSLQTMHYSKKYDNAPMPHSIFFSGGYAIHATPHIGNLGRPVSHGCIRLAPTNALTLYDIVKANKNETTITIR